MGMGMGRGMNLGFQRGIRDSNTKPEPKPKPATDGRMKLRNGDTIGGEVTAIADGIISIKTPFADVKLPVARVVWVPKPDLKIGAGAWILAGGAHHTSFSGAVNAGHLRDFAEMAGIEFLLIDENTRMEEFKDKLRWNDLYYRLAAGL